MVRVFYSRYSPELKPGDGHRINWEIGEEVTVVSGQDKGRPFMVLTEGRSHAGLPEGEYCREGYFTDGFTEGRVAKPEKTLWYKEGK
jgi:hypothetical protein